MDKKEPSSSHQEVSDPELQDLLLDALNDFTKPLNATDLTSKGENVEPLQNCDETLNEEFIQNATKNFEATLRAMVHQQKTHDQCQDTTRTDNSNMIGPGDMEAFSAEFLKSLEMDKQNPQSTTEEEWDFERSMAMTMKCLASNNQELKLMGSLSDLNKMFDNLGLGGDADASSVLPLMQSILQNLLSKNVLYGPLKELVDKYPKWLAENRSVLAEDEFCRLSKQYSSIKEVVELYEAESPNDTEDIKCKRFEEIMIKMQKIQELGHPPKDLCDVGSLMDSAETSMFPDFNSLLGSNSADGSSSGTSEGCAIM